MKNYKLFFSTILLGLFLSSCSPIMKMLYGIKDPKVENEASLSKYMKKKDIYSDNVYTLDFESYQKALKLINNKLPEVMIFDTQGNYIPYGDEWACNAGAFNFIEELNDTTDYSISNKTSIEELSSKLRNLKGEKVKVVNENENFYVFIFWAKFTGKLNKDHVKVWEEQANQNNSNIQIIKVNMDFQEHWGEEVTDQLE